MNEEQHMKVIGKEIPWQSIEGKVFRVQHFTPYAKLEGQKAVHPARHLLPYALLIIEDPTSPELLEMPVLHRIDFRNLWDIFNRDMLAGDCLYVSYYPIYGAFIRNTLRLFAIILPQLGLITAPEGIEMLDQSGKVSPAWRQASTIIWTPQQHIDKESTVLDRYRESGLFPLSGTHKQSNSRSTETCQRI